ncbi:MAG: type II 3-dehydroquinate dehydratase [Candidatus Obscuribacterales bacterium]|nr:type II 3-dehydroquinate dehydratase [Candidatus Obscuribacterales bacterium]
MIKLLVINGPNLNFLGLRETSHYGTLTLKDIEANLEVRLKDKAELSFFQSNHEGAIVDRIQAAYQEFKQLEEDQESKGGIVINPGAYGHTSIAIRDALLATAIKFVEVHISNVYARDEFRHKSMLSDIASGVIVGCGALGYELAAEALLAKLS